MSDVDVVTCECPDREVGLHAPSCPRVASEMRARMRVAGLVIADLMGDGAPPVVWRTATRSIHSAEFPAVEGQIDRRDDVAAVIMAYSERWDAPIFDMFGDGTTIAVCTELRGIHVRVWAPTGREATRDEDGPDPDRLEAEFEAERRGLEDGDRP